METLRSHRDELAASGVASLSLFGSVARGDDSEGSDVDIVVKLRDDAKQGLAYFGTMETLGIRLSVILDRHVDLVTEPVKKQALRRSIERDRVVALEDPIIF
ncbi:nucleotidyltransferase domain-containing protein [Inquilinus sp. CAU 1745]|uniref:nucleotidyltransferase family protein n=1 Tax=Inquilinus sp. CAU 1745 TaxID=3140369 RepID=UPI00325B5090